MSTDFYVYLHRKATTGQVFYVGKGAGRRAWEHGEARRGTLWQRTARKHGLIVEIAADGLQEWYAHEMECELIALHGRRDSGCGPLVNMTDGGEGTSGRVVPDYVRAKHKAAAQAKAANPECRAKHKAAMQALATDPGWLAKTKDVLQARATDPGWRARNKAAVQARAADPGWLAKTKAAAQARAVDPVWLAKNKAAREAVYADPVVKAKHKAAVQARAADPEWLAKNKAANRARLCRPVECIETGERFDSATDAARALRARGHPKAVHGRISACARGGSTKAYSHTWRYA